MADESSSLLQTAPEFDELELEELDDSADLSTGEFIRPPLAAQSSSGRSSAPPPLPPEARERRSTPPNGTLRPPPPAGITLPPPPPRSGMYRIDPVGRVPALPVPATDLATLQGHLQALTRELRDLSAHNDRLRLTVRLRDDRIRELEQAVREQSARAEALSAQLASVNEHKEKVADDLKRIPGIGPGFERALHEQGVTSFAQIADWTLEDVERVARHLRTAPARIVRGGWIERARELAAPSQG